MALNENGFKAKCEPCILCGEQVVFASYDLYKNKKYWGMCPDCIHKAVENQREERAKKEEVIKSERRKQEYINFLTQLENYNVIPYDKICPAGNDVLYIIGNGFDLMHNVRSSYYNFRDSMGKSNKLRETLESFLKSKDIWSDFENSLAQFDVDLMCSAEMLGTHLDTMEAYCEDGGGAEFYRALDLATWPMNDVVEQLPKKLAKWVDTLKIGTDDRPLKNMFVDGKVLCFNYTEFVEQLYNVQSSNICYIHGCRKNKHGKLIIGHSYDADVDLYNVSGGPKYRKNAHRRELFVAAKEMVTPRISEYDDALTKHCDKIIKEHENFFSSLNAIREIIVIGHSMSKADLPYFAEIAKRVSDLDSVKWYFGCYGNADLQNMAEVIKQLRIANDNVFVFRTDEIRTTLKSGTYEPVVNRRAKPKEKTTASANGAWCASVEGGHLQIYNKEKSAHFSFNFSEYINTMVFAPAGDYLVVTNYYKMSIFIFRLAEGQWIFVNELQNPSQRDLINNSLDSIYLQADKILFVYNNRVRGYSVLDGEMLFNDAVKHALQHYYIGEEVYNKLVGRV